MAIRQTELATGQQQAPQAYTSGAVACYVSTFTIPTGMTVATTDIIEIGVLPAYSRIVDATLIPKGNFGASVTADVGIMSGEVGDPTSTRTSGDEVFDGATLTGLVRMTDVDAVLVAASDDHRSVGVKFSDAITGAGQTITLQLLYTQ